MSKSVLVRILNWALFVFAGVFILVTAVTLYLNYSDKYSVPIMMYHSVNGPQAPYAGVVSPKRFEEHLSFLKKHRYNVISLDTLIESMLENRRLPRNSVVITFDDGFEDNYTYAYPLLKKYGFPATIFLTAGEIGKEHFLKWEQIKEMASAGLEFGSHTLTHAYLPDQDEQDLYMELKSSKVLLEKELGGPVKYLAYPSGGFNHQVKEIAQQVGYWAACTTNRGYAPGAEDPYELKRIRFGNADNSAVILRVKLSGFYNLFRKPKSPE